VPETKSKLTEYYTETGPERCGLLLTSGEVLETPNVAEDPELGFEIPVEMLLEKLPDLEGTWHTHPGLSSNLSQADFTGFSAWPELDHYIVGNDGTRLYRVEAPGVILQVTE
jgi:proteasome lid subunit RPN8/RPN11